MGGYEHEYGHVATAWIKIDVLYIDVLIVRRCASFSGSCVELSTALA